MAVIFEQTRPADYLTRFATSDAGRSSKALALRELDIAPGDTVLDLGCGPGADLLALADAAGPNGQVLGLDHDPEAVAQARSVVVARPTVTVRVADVHSLELPDRCVDRAHTDRVLQHVVDPAGVLVEIARVLRPDGRAVFAEPDWDTLVVDHPDPALVASYRRFVTDRVVRNARVGRQLPRLLDDAGLHAIRVLPVTTVFRDVVAADRVFGLQRVARRAVQHGYLSDAEYRAWLDHLSHRPFLASATLFVTVAEPGR